MAKDTFLAPWFKHDYNARGDEKIIGLIRRHGYLGYGLYWVVIEKLYEAGGKIKPDYETLAYDLRCEAQIIKSIVEDFDLFYFTSDVLDDATRFGSKSVDRRLRQCREQSDAARSAAEKRWANHKTVKDATAMRPHSVGNATAMPEEKRREDEIRADKKERMGRVRAAFIPPSIEEVKAYCLERTKGVDAQKWHDYYSANGWRVGKNPMKDWKAAVRTWEKNNGFGAKQNYGQSRVVGQAAPIPGKYDAIDGAV